MLRASRKVRTTWLAVRQPDHRRKRGDIESGPRASGGTSLPAATAVGGGGRQAIDRRQECRCGEDNDDAISQAPQAHAVG
jgi:hypothetical protein